MSNDLIKLHLKTLEASVKSPFAVFALINGSEDMKALSASIKSLAKTLDFFSDIFLESEIDTADPDLTVRFDKPNKKEYDETYFRPHIMAGYSPFMLQKEGKVITGALVKLQHKNVSYCQKTIKRLVRQRFEEALRNDEPLTFKECKRHIETLLKEGKMSDPVPLVDKYQDHYFYLDFKNQIVLAKNAHRTKDIINMFFSLLLKVGKSLSDRHPELLEKIDKMMTETLKERMDIVPYSTYALTHEKAFGAYSIHDAVVYYSKEESDNDAKPIPFLPTDTAGFFSETKMDARIDFRNAVGYFLGHNEKTLPSYRTLSSFSDKHVLRAYSLRVTGEIPLTDPIKRFKEAFPESIGDEIAGEYLSMSFDTKASDGNVTFKITEGLFWPVEAARRLLNQLFGDTHIGKKQLEQTLLKEFGALLEVLHHSCSLFIEFYVRANQAPEEMGETELEKDLKQAQIDAEAPLGPVSQEAAENADDKAA